MKKVILLAVLIGILLTIPVYMFVDNKRQTQKIIDMERTKRDSIIQIKVARFAKAIYGNQCKADSIINLINEDRKRKGLPELDLKIQGEITETYDPELYFYNGVVMYGACRLDTVSDNIANGVLFHVSRPDDIHYLSFYKIDDRFFKAHSRRKYSSYKMWMRKDILPSEFEGVLGK